MRSTFRIAAFVLAIGSATALSAQPRSTSHSFVDEFNALQSVAASSGSALRGSATHGHGTTNVVGVQTESFAERFTRLQVQGSNSAGVWAPRHVIAAAAAPADADLSFGERIAEMQAAASSSGQFGFYPGDDVPAGLAHNTRVDPTRDQEEATRVGRADETDATTL